MGGYNAGEVASTMATSFIKTELGRWLHEAMGHATDTEIRRAMDICVDNANRAIFNAANSNPQYAGMARRQIKPVAAALVISLLLIGVVLTRSRTGWLLVFALGFAAMLFKWPSGGKVNRAAVAGLLQIGRAHV